MKIILSLFSATLILACNPPSSTHSLSSNKQAVGPNLDSLNALFISGWNNRDSTAIMNTIAPDAIVMNDSLIHNGQVAIATNWVSGGVKVLSNIQTTSLHRQAVEDLAYDGGTYSLDLTIPGGPILKEKGNYTLIWKMQSDRQWKLTHIHIEDITRMPDIPNELNVAPAK